MTDRVRVAITPASSVDGPARVTSLDALQELLEDLWEYGPEPEGVVEINPAVLDELPEGWTVEEMPDE